MLAYEDKVTKNKVGFINKVIDVAKFLQTDPNYLMAVMWAESKLNPQSQNTTYPLRGGPATGLIQFTPDTALSMGTSIEVLRLMNNIDQLDYVKEYLRPYRGRLNSYFDVYTSVFFPAAIGKPDDWTFETKKISRSSVARQNPSIDFNRDGKITVAEFKQYLNNTIPAKLKNLIFNVKQNPGKSTLIVVAGALLFWFLLKK